MTLVGWAQIALVLALVLGCAVPLSRFIARVFAGERNFLSPVLGPVERGFYRLAGVDPAREQDWFAYTMAMLAFSVAGFLVLYACSGSRACCRSIRAASMAVRRISPSTRR